MEERTQSVCFATRPGLIGAAPPRTSFGPNSKGLLTGERFHHRGDSYHDLLSSTEMMFRFPVAVMKMSAVSTTSSSSATW